MGWGWVGEGTGGRVAVMLMGLGLGLGLGSKDGLDGMECGWDGEVRNGIEWCAVGLNGV